MSGDRVMASSHREAPFVTQNPKVDATDFYMFNSYEDGRSAYVTLIANYVPLQDAYGGPNYFKMDPNALYEIHVDNSGDAQEDLTFQFRFTNTLKATDGLKVPVGDKMIAVPLQNIGPVTAADQSALNIDETYTLTVVRGNRRTGTAVNATNAANSSVIFSKPSDYIGTKSFPDYAAYVAPYVYNVNFNIPNCTTPGRVFVGQRAESFAVNLGAIFDLVHAPPAVVIGGNTLAGRMVAPSTIADKNITTLALEVPTACLVATGKTIIGGWTTASVPQARAINPKATYGLPAKEGGAWAQVSRLGNPLVNEVVIGVKDKDRFNSSEPKDDAQFLDYVTNPALPKLLEVLFGSAGVMAPTTFPRADLVAAFLTGVDTVNKDGSTGEILRLNTAIAAHKAMQNNLGAAQCFVNGVLTTANANCDPAGFPNGRRPGDDVTDIALRAMMGFLLPPASAPSGQLGFTDGVLQDASQFDATFPYLTIPHPGASGAM
ncbi:MAG TPA: DUF4331 domain-containing protein [Polyangia bacterium]